MIFVTQGVCLRRRRRWSWIRNLHFHWARNPLAKMWRWSSFSQSDPMQIEREEVIQRRFWRESSKILEDSSPSREPINLTVKSHENRHNWKASKWLSWDDEKEQLNSSLSNERTVFYPLWRAHKSLFSNKAEQLNLIVLLSLFKLDNNSGRIVIVKGVVKQPFKRSGNERNFPSS